MRNCPGPEDHFRQWTRRHEKGHDKREFWKVPWFQDRSQNGE